MIQKKICMLGAFAVGKTSLVQRFVSSIFDERYHTTVGVKIDRKDVRVGDRDVSLMLWDIHGEDEFQKLRLSYLRGSSGYLVVADGTRRTTLDRAYALQGVAERTVGKAPFVLLVNKADLKGDWNLEPGDLDEARSRGWKVLETSAKTGDHVEEAFLHLASRMLEG